MARGDKTLAAMRANPRDWRIGSLEAVAATEYRFTIRRLTMDEGGGYLMEFPDLPGCMSDGETVEDAIANGMEAKRDWIAAMIEVGRPVQPPDFEGQSA